MALGALVTVTPVLLEDQDLVGLGLLQNRRGDGRAIDQRRTDGLAGAIADEEDLVEANFGAGIAIEFLDRQDIALANLVLLPAGLDDCEHRITEPPVISCLIACASPLGLRAPGCRAARTIAARATLSTA
jgi:hypothetical protein